MNTSEITQKQGNTRQFRSFSMTKFKAQIFWNIVYIAKFDNINIIQEKNNCVFCVRGR